MKKNVSRYTYIHALSGLMLALIFTAPVNAEPVLSGKIRYMLGNETISSRALDRPELAINPSALQILISQIDQELVQYAGYSGRQQLQKAIGQEETGFRQSELQYQGDNRSVKRVSYGRPQDHL